MDISRTNLCNWAIKAAEACAPLLDIMKDHIASGSVINAGETHLQVLKEDNRQAQTKSWMWLFVGGPPEKRAVLFQYDKNRNAGVPEDFLRSFTGYLQTDGYKAYHTALKTGFPMRGLTTARNSFNGTRRLNGKGIIN